MPRVEHGGDAGRARRADEFRIAGDRLCGCCIVRVGRKRSKCCTRGPRRHLADRAEVSASKVVRHGREIIVVDARDCSRDLVDRIIRTWPRAVPALIGRRQLERGVGLLRTLHQVDDRPSVRRKQSAPCVGVDRIFGALHPRMRRDLASGPVRLVERRLLVADEGEDQCPARLGLLQAQDGRHQGGDAGLVVDACRVRRNSRLLRSACTDRASSPRAVHRQRPCGRRRGSASHSGRSPGRERACRPFPRSEAWRCSRPQRLRPGAPFRGS